MSGTITYNRYAVSRNLPETLLRCLKVDELMLGELPCIYNIYLYTIYYNTTISYYFYSIF